MRTAKRPANARNVIRIIFPDPDIVEVPTGAEV